MIQSGRPAGFSESAASASGDAWNADARGQPQTSLSLDVGEHVVALAWAPDGRALAVAGADGGITLIEPAADTLLRCLGRHCGGALTVAFSNDSTQIASGGQDGTLRIYSRDPAAGERAVELPEQWTGQVVFSPDGQALAVAAGRRVVLYDSVTLAVRHQFAPLPSTIEALAFSPDGQQLAAASYGGLTLLSPQAPFATRLLPWRGSCLALAWRPNGKVIAAGGQDASVQFWRLPKARQAAMSGFATKVRELAWSRDGRWLASGGSSSVALWDFKNGPEGSLPYTLHYHREPIVGLAWQSHGKLLASVARDSLLLLWDPDDEDWPLDVYRLPSLPTTLAWSPDDKLLAIGGDGGEITFVQSKVHSA